MSKKIDAIIGRIRELEHELKEEIEVREKELSYTIEKHKVYFEEEILAKHKQEAQNVFRYVFTAPILNLASAPVIYFLALPAFVLDLCVSIYQTICFPVYKIEKVKRREYIVIDRHYLRYLNSVEKLNCIYCGYMNGVIAYITEVAARTEQYWCPIKHASKVAAMHSRYKNFVDYGDAQSYRHELKRIRELLKNEDKKPLN